MPDYSEKEKELADRFDELVTAVSAAGGATQGLFVQTMTNGDPFGAKGKFYRVARRVGDEVEFPFGESFARAAELVRLIEFARRALWLVPEHDRA